MADLRNGGGIILKVSIDRIKAVIGLFTGNKVGIYVKDFSLRNLPIWRDVRFRDKPFVVVLAMLLQSGRPISLRAYLNFYPVKINNQLVL